MKSPSLNWVSPLRVSATDDSSIHKCLLAQRPVIISGLLSDAPIFEIRSVADAETQIADVPVVVRRDYFTTLSRAKSLVPELPRISRLGEFLVSQRETPDSTFVITEQPCPPELASRLSVPLLCRFRQGEDGTEDIVSEIFVAGTGAVAHLHFDWDHRHVVLYQIFGRKRVVVVPPSVSPLLRPVLNMSRLAIQRLAEPLRTEFIRGIGGLDVVLEPGEAIMIPALAWHYVEYLDVAMSVSFRFGRSLYGRVYAERFHASHALQLFAWRTMNDSPLVGSHRAAFQTLIREYLATSEADEHLFDQMARMFKALFQTGLDNFDAISPWVETHAIERKSVVASGLYRKGCNSMDSQALRKMLLM